MPDYRTPLPGIMATLLEGAVNRILALDEDSSTRLERLDGRLLQLDLEGIGITLFFAFAQQRVSVKLDVDADPDTVVSGTPVALFSMAMPDDDGSWGTPGSRVRISGDANLARDLERLFSRFDPDWEGRLSRIFGDVLGHQVAAGVSSGAEQAKEALGTTGEMISEFLKRESGPLVGSGELKSFADAVDETRDAVERLEAALRIMREKEE
jgi:ubiquinone biosynthesis protein UbiJ